MGTQTPFGGNNGRRSSLTHETTNLFIEKNGNDSLLVGGIQLGIHTSRQRSACEIIRPHARGKPRNGLDGFKLRQLNCPDGEIGRHSGLIPYGHRFTVGLCQSRGLTVRKDMSTTEKMVSSQLAPLTLVSVGARAKA